MPKTITTNILHAMSPAQIGILHANASARDTPAAHDLLQRLAAEGLVKPEKLPGSSSPARKVTLARASKAPKAQKATPVVHGRRA